MAVSRHQVTSLPPRLQIYRGDNYLDAGGYRYIELNPVRAAMVDLPADYPWSSFRANALGEHSPLISAHPSYLALGVSGPQRQAAYRELFSAHIDPKMLTDVRACVQTGTPLGNDRFRLQIEQALGVKVGYSTRGRPKIRPIALGQDVHQIELKPSTGL